MAVLSVLGPDIKSHSLCHLVASLELPGHLVCTTVLVHRHHPVAHKQSNTTSPRHHMHATVLFTANIVQPSTANGQHAGFGYEGRPHSDSSNRLPRWQQTPIYCLHGHNRRLHAAWWLLPPPLQDLPPYQILILALQHHNPPAQPVNQLGLQVCQVHILLVDNGNQPVHLNIHFRTYGLNLHSQTESVLQMLLALH